MPPRIKIHMGGWLPDESLQLVFKGDHVRRLAGGQAGAEPCATPSVLRAPQDSRAGFYELSNPDDPHTFELQILSDLPREAVDIAPQPYRIALAIHPYTAQ
jgi:hypothetical protein